MRSASARRQFIKTLFSSAIVGCSSGSFAHDGDHTSAKRRLRVERHSARLPRLPAGLDGFRIVQISDLHLEPFTTAEEIQETVTTCNALRPDLVAMTGDFVTDTARPVGLLAELVAQLQAPYGVFASLGNHDFWCGHEAVVKALKERRVPVLRNETRLIHADGGTLTLGGMDTRYMGPHDLRATLSGWRSHQPLVMMMHEPDVVDDLAAAGVQGLQLSGHTHGGQIRLTKLPVPGFRRARWGKRYLAGSYQVGAMHLYVNRGIGSVGVPWRVQCPPEITEITLRSPMAA